MLILDILRRHYIDMYLQLVAGEAVTSSGTKACQLETIRCFLYSFSTWEITGYRKDSNRVFEQGEDIAVFLEILNILTMYCNCVSCSSRGVRPKGRWVSLKLGYMFHGHVTDNIW